VIHGLKVHDYDAGYTMGKSFEETNLAKSVPYIGDMLGKYQHWVFHDLQPRLKLTSYRVRLAENTKTYSGKLTADQISAKTASEVNNAFGGQNWENFKEAIQERSRLWAKDAAAIVFFVSKLAVFARGEHKISRSHAFDTGAAWENFALQATMLGWAVHAIGGFDAKNAPRLLGIPEDGWQIHCAVTIGRRGDKSFLLEEFAAREHPNVRVPLNLLLMEGGFKPELTDFPPGTPGSPR
jgi:nitroreductase